MINYKSMALSSITNRTKEQLIGWREDLIDTIQYELAETLVDVIAGVPVTDLEAFTLAFYMLHVEHQE